jgi:hypothetical protein
MPDVSTKTRCTPVEVLSPDPLAPIATRFGLNITERHSRAAHDEAVWNITRVGGPDAVPPPVAAESTSSTEPSANKTESLPSGWAEGDG